MTGNLKPGWLTVLALCWSAATAAGLIDWNRDALARWREVGKIDRKLESADPGTVVLNVTAGNNQGVWTGPVLTVEKDRKYRLKFRYRLRQGSLLVIAKHGNNTYGALSRKLTAATGDQWQEFQSEFVNGVDGSHASVWLMGPGRFEVGDLSLVPLPSPEELRLARTLKPTPAAALPPPPDLSLPDLSHVKVIAQEWHLWFSADLGRNDPLWQVWNSDSPASNCYLVSGPLWRRAINDLVYPYLGPYSAENPEIIRWQIRVMKNCGLDGTTCQMYPVPGRGEYFCNEDVFETCLRIAQEEGYQLGVHDEIQFMKKSAQSVEAFVARAVRTLRLAEKYPRGYLAIDGMPVYQYEAFALPWTPEQHDRMMVEVEKQLGKKVFWMVSGPVDKMVRVKNLRCLKNPANLWSCVSGETGAPENRPDFATALSTVQAAVRAANADRSVKLQQAPWVYPGFNNASWKRNARRFPAVAADRAAFFARSLREAAAVKPALINLAGWNERSEKTCLEPSWNNENPDPFHLVKMIAAAKKVKFTAPPLPPREAVDPLMWSVLYGVDRTPPAIVGARAHVSEANLAVDCLDDLSGVAGVAISAAPTAWVRFTGTPVGFNASGTVNPETAREPGGVRIEADRQTVLRIQLTGAPPVGGNFWLGLKYRAGENTGILCRMNYRRRVPHSRFKLNNQKISTVPRGPLLVGTGKSAWYVLPLRDVELQSDAITISMRRTGTHPAEAARLEELVLLPEKLTSEAEAFPLPGPGRQYRSFVVQLPSRLLPRDYFGIPLAVQCSDAEGNLSVPRIFELEEEWRRTAPAAVSLDCVNFRWYQ